MTDHLFEKFFPKNRIARVDLYPLKDAQVFYINPNLIGQYLNLSWFQNHSQIIKTAAVITRKVIGEEPVASHVALDSGRSIVLPSHEFRAPNGQVYRDVMIKGIGPIAPFVGQANKHNPIDCDGVMSLGEGYMDLAQSNILLSAGIRVPLGMCLIDTGLRRLDRIKMHKTDKFFKLCHNKIGIYVRAMTVATRVYNLRGLSAKELEAYLNYELAYLSRIENLDLTDLNTYLKWFAKNLATQVAKMQKIGFLHDTPHSQQVCIDGTICDFEHDAEHGFLEDPKPESYYRVPDYSFAKQPKYFSTHVAHDKFEDNMWQVVRKILANKIISKDEILDIYWNRFHKVYKSWIAPDIKPLIKAYGLADDKLTDMIYDEHVLDHQIQPRQIKIRLVSEGQNIKKYSF